MKAFLFIILTFLVSLFVSVGLIVLIKDNYLLNCGDLFFPSNLDSLKTLVNDVNVCYVDNKLGIHIIHMICFIFLQTWCIPGTILFNLFGGAVFGVYKGFIFCLIVSTP